MSNTEPSEPALAIVIVNFNYAEFLPQAIESALAQTAGPIEVIVVDDCSTDGSHAVIAGYGARIHAIFRTVNGGMSAAVNSGFAASTAPVVMFLDADDFLYPHAAAEILLRWHAGIAQIQARLDLVDVEGKVEDVFPPFELAMDRGDVTPELALRGRYSTTVTSGLAFARKALDRVMPIPELAFDRSADGYLATVVPLYGAVESIELPIGGYRRHPSNHSGFQADMAARARWRVDHDEQRYIALRKHAAGRALKIAERPGWADATHLEQRLTSLCFDPARHPYPGDKRKTISWAGAKVAFAGRMSLARRASHAGMFLIAGLAPPYIARRALAWKLERSSRPQIIDRLAGILRRIMG